MFFGDWTYILIIPAAIFALIAQARVSRAFNRFSDVMNRKGLTGAETARLILERAGITDVNVERVDGRLTDHYDPRSRTLRLSADVFGSKSLSAVGVAAHETGHALQDNEAYAALGLRSALVPVVGFGSNLAWPVTLIGFLLTQFSGDIGMLFINIGIIMFALVVVFSLVTLPVEFNASARAVDLLSAQRILDDDEIVPVRKVLSAAAMTYVASAAAAIMNLIRVVLLSNSRRKS